MSSSSIQRYTIMVAEDFDDTRTLLRRALELRGYRVVEARDGLEAVKLVEQLCPDLILMDLNMPHLDGLAATEQIRECRELCQTVTIVAITAHDTYGMREAALAAGCNEYLTKPIDFERLGSIVDSMLVSH